MASRRDAERGRLDLVPFMNLMALLVPFLLMSAQFVTYAVIDTALPTIASVPEPDGEVAGARPSPVVVRIGDAGLTVLGADAQPFPGVPAAVPCLDGACARVDAFDLDGLVRALTAIKALRPEREDLVIAPAGWVPYEVVVAVMDAARVDPRADGGPRELFPRVVVASGGE